MFALLFLFCTLAIPVQYNRVTVINLTNVLRQLTMVSKTRYFAEGSPIADNRELANGLMVITSGSVGIELPMDSAEADEENTKPKDTTLLYIRVLGRG